MIYDPCYGMYCYECYPCGTLVYISAYPCMGWEFDRWTGDVDTVDDIYCSWAEVRMDGDYNISATFNYVGCGTGTLTPTVTPTVSPTMTP